MPLRPLPYREVRRKLIAAGFEEAGQRGSHVKYARTDPEGIPSAARADPIRRFRSGFDKRPHEALSSALLC